MRAFLWFMAFALVTVMAFAQNPGTKKQAARGRAAPAAQQHQQASQAEDRQAIEELHQQDIAASLAFDVDKLASIWDNEIVSMPPGSKPIVGAAANHEFLASQQKAMANVEILAYEETWDEVRILGEYAYEYGSIRSRIRQAGEKEETALEFNVMRVLKKQPTGIWKVYRTIWNDRKSPATPEKYRNQ